MTTGIRQRLSFKMHRGARIAAAALAALFSISIFPAVSGAVPMFAREIGRDCTYCHTVLPKLNETGRIYRANGYRFSAEGQWKNVKDWTHLPLSVEIALEGFYSNSKTSGVETTSSDLVVEEFELITGGTMGKTGKVSALATVAIKQVDAVGSTTYKPVIEQAFIRVNDLAGETGEGLLNLKAGQDVFSLPFLSNRQRPMAARYFVESAMNILNRGHRVVELNGTVVADEESWEPTHRYSIGIGRDDINSDDKLKAYYATYSATVRENFSIGLLYWRGKELYASSDVSYRKYGAAFEGVLGPVTATAGVFRSDRIDAPDLRDTLVEVFYTPAAKWSLGGRYEFFRKKGRQGAKSHSFMARYSILSNAFAQMEFDRLLDRDHGAGTIEDEKKLVFQLVTLY